MNKKQMMEELRMQLNNRGYEELDSYLEMKERDMFDEGEEKRLRKNKLKRERTLYEDAYNPSKTWEVTELSGGKYYLRQYNANRQQSRGRNVTKEKLEELGIFEMKILKHVYN